MSSCVAQKEIENPHDAFEHYVRAGGKDPVIIKTETYGLIVMCGAVVDGRLEKVPVPGEIVTIIGTSPAPANESSRVKSTRSKPGISGFGPMKVTAPVMSVVPIVTITVGAVEKRTPVRLISNTVWT